MPDALVSLWNIALVLVGFGFVIFWHELGHFLAARWAKIRVHEFAIGFGPAILAYRRGIGLRRGSTNPDYQKLLTRHRREADETTGAPPESVPGVSQTEYRLNWVPLGGYVRMLGQEDANPGATSNAPDSYTSVPIWKRMVVVSAGVIMNVLLAAVLFIFVYNVGLESNAPVISVPSNSVAYQAGLRTDDVVTSVNGERVEVFQDLLLHIGLSKKDRPVVIEVERPGVGDLSFEVNAEYNEQAQIRAIGVYAQSSATLLNPDVDALESFDNALASMGLDDLEPGATLVEVDGLPVEPTPVDPWGAVALPTMLLDAARASEGAPVPVVFAERDGTRQERFFLPLEVLDIVPVEVEPDERWGVDHLLGLTPVLSVERVQDRGFEAGLRDGDVFLRLGAVTTPHIAQGIRAIRAHKGASVSAQVLRDGALIDLSLPVDAQGLVGFSPGQALDRAFLASTPEIEDNTLTLVPTPGPGTMLVSVAGTPVGSILEARTALIDATSEAFAASMGATVDVEIRALEPGSASEGPVRSVAWPLDAPTVAHLHALGWTGERVLGVFAPATVLQVGSDPMHSIALGLRETRRMLVRVYLTLGRLSDGSVKPQQLKGPVGITHIGSRVAREGVIRLLFFIGLISANLAVLNFLPLPIVDGGLFLMLLYEMIARKPVPVVAQNILTIIGLILIASVFIFVTTNDVINLF